MQTNTIAIFYILFFILVGKMKGPRVNLVMRADLLFEKLTLH